MGYTTYFNGCISFDKPVKDEHAEYINLFSSTRRMKRNASITEQRPDPVREAADLPVGLEGCYFVGEDGFAGQSAGPDVIDNNRPPEEQPGLWCQWIIDGDGDLVWDEGEKFYNYVEWMQYLITHFFKPWGYVLNGEITWQGEDDDDRGKIVVKDNEVSTLTGRVVYE